MHNFALSLYTAVNEVRCAIYPWVRTSTGWCLHRSSSTKVLWPHCTEILILPLCLRFWDRREEKESLISHYQGKKKRKKKKEANTCSSQFLGLFVFVLLCFWVCTGRYEWTILVLRYSKNQSGHDLSACTGTSVRNVWKEIQVSAV